MRYARYGTVVGATLLGLCGLFMSVCGGVYLVTYLFAIVVVPIAVPSVALGILFIVRAWNLLRRE